MGAYSSLVVVTGLMRRVQSWIIEKCLIARFLFIIGLVLSCVGSEIIFGSGCFTGRAFGLSSVQGSSWPAGVGFVFQDLGSTIMDFSKFVRFYLGFFMVSIELALDPMEMAQDLPCTFWALI